MKIISTVNINNKKAAKNSPSPLTALFELHKCNQDNQEKLPGCLFDFSKQLQVFKYDFKVAMYGQAYWRQILQINTAKYIRGILINLKLIDEQDLKGARLKRSPDEATAAKNMYIVLWKLFACPIKTAMQTYAVNNKIDGPDLLYHLLWQYTRTDELFSWTYQLSLNNLPEKLEELGFNVNKFCNCAAETLKTLHNAGDNDTQASLK
eukprot:3994995-Ditylum_brightwellii.AAC.1